ncbi:ATP-binding protein [Ochrobactrum vermis]|uniref:ATP-binding protein n=1 Tax=Ochrobactrum vermis TaxID=1827297 RepID=UPI003306EDEA
MQIEIADQGNGPPANQEDAVFERFRKLSPDTRGAGLGLSIAREIAIQHGGRIAFQRNSGSVLEIALPIDSPPRST